MAVQCIELKQAIERDAGLLLDGQGVIGRLKPDQGALSPLLGQHVAFQVEGIGISLQAIGDPAEPRSQQALPPAVEDASLKREAPGRQHCPNAKAERLTGPPNQRQRQHAPNKVVLTVDDTEVLGQDVVCGQNAGVRALVRAA